MGGWRQQAACAGMDVNLFFPVGEFRGVHAVQVEEAKRVCRRCSVRDECLESALESREKYGVFGGLTPAERLLLLRRVRRAAA